MRENAPVNLSDLLLLGRGSDLASERGVSCDGQLPAASDPQLVDRARAARKALGTSVLVLGHHYQRNEVIEFACERLKNYNYIVNNFFKNKCKKIRIRT